MLPSIRKSTDCFICLSPYRHRNLHTERLRDKLLTMSPYEMDLLPILWRNVLFKNPNFCEHVCHSWLQRSLRLMSLQQANGMLPLVETVYLESPDYYLIRRESMRLEELLGGVIEGIQNNQQIFESSSYINVYTTKSYGKKKKVTWRPSGQRKIVGTWFGLAESLIEQYNGQLELEDVHEREMRLIVWKHFTLALAQCLLNSS